jgi:signal transduction histidine kinase
MVEKEGVDKLAVVKWFFLIFTLISILVFELSAGLYYLKWNEKKSILETSERERIENAKDYISSSLSSSSIDLFVLSENNVFKEIKSNDVGSDVLRNDLIFRIYMLVKLNEEYERIVLFNETGEQILNINDGGWHSKEDLQDRKYLIEPMIKSLIDEALKQGGTNMLFIPAEENDGHHVIWFATSVADSDNRNAIALEYSVDELISSLAKRFGSDDRQFIFLDSNGGIHIIKNKNQDWGTVDEDKIMYYLSEGWNVIETKETGQFYIEDGLVTFTTIYPLHSANRYLKNLEFPDNGYLIFQNNTNDLSWKLVSVISKEKIDSIRNSILVDFVLFDAIILGVAASLSLPLSYFIERRKKAQKEIGMYAARLEEKNKMLTLFLDIIRHDLKNPISVAYGYIDLMDSESTNDNNKTMFEKIRKQLKRAIEIMDNAKKLSKVENIKELEKKEIDLRLLIDELITNFKLKSEEPSIKIENNVEENVKIMANDLIEDVFANLISNAIKYAGGDKKIRIDCIETEEYIRVRVIDYGPGVDDENKEVIFDRFERGGLTDITGTGLGLAISKKIVELHSGKIWVEDNPEGGAIFVVELPKETI